MNHCVRCGARATQLHHCVYVQELRHYARSHHRDGLTLATLAKDERNLIPVCVPCHAEHHNRSRPFSLYMLPDSAFTFAAEVLGALPAYEYLNRRYEGTDARHEALLGAFV
jgi:cytochrome c553